MDSASGGNVFRNQRGSKRTGNAKLLTDSTWAKEGEDGKEMMSSRRWGLEFGEFDNLMKLIN